jgi:hypothetical protein
MAAVFTALMLTATPRPSDAEELKPVSCTGFALAYSDPTAKLKCASLDSYGNQTEAVYDQISAETATYFFAMQYAKAKFRTYFTAQSLRNMINDSNYFSDTDNWQEVRSFSGFEVAAFNGYQKAGDPPILCAGFLRYSGTQAANYEYDGGPGFPQFATGIYCAFSGQAALINPIDNFYRVVQDALAKVTFPPE